MINAEDVLSRLKALKDIYDDEGNIISNGAVQDAVAIIEQLTPPAPFVPLPAYFTEDDVFVIGQAVLIWLIAHGEQLGDDEEVSGGIITTICREYIERQEAARG